MTAPLPSTGPSHSTDPILLPAPSAMTGAKAQPLIITALPPIPGKVVEKASKGEYIDLKELLPDNIALLKRIHEINPANLPTQHNSRLRDISDPLPWVSCFLGFVAAKVDHKETRELVAYTQIVIDLARKHGGHGWLAYDARFHQQISAGSPLVSS